MGERLALHNILLSIVGNGNVYFQPPASYQMLYPCVVYSRNDIETTFANNNPYIHKKQYSVTVIDADPDSPIPDKIAELPLCSFNRAFKTDNLNHDVFTLFY